MVSNSLRQLLQSLCCNSPWDYAVFWRLQHLQSQMLLTWEDGFFSLSRPRQSTVDTVDSSYFDWSNERSSPSRSGYQDGNLADSPIGVMMAEMSSIYYVAGKGVVGEVVYSDSPSWFFADSIMAGGYNFNLIAECPDELLRQFVAGIQTVLLMPLVPFGVLQLGSLEKVADDAGLVACIKNKFDAHQLVAVDAKPFRLDRKLVVQPPEDCAYKGSLVISGNTINKVDGDLKVLDSIDVGCQKMPDTEQMMSMAQDLHEIYGRDILKITDKGSESKLNIPPIALYNGCEPSTYPTLANSELEMVHDFFRSSCLGESLEAFSFSDCEMAHHNMSVHKIMESYSNDGTIEWPFQEDCTDTSCKSENLFLRFPSDSELHKALGSVSRDQADPNWLRPAGSTESATRSSVCEKGAGHSTQPLTWDSGGGPLEDKTEYLLEAVVVRASNVSDGSLANRSCSTTMSPQASSGGFASQQIDQCAFSGDDQVPLSCVTSAHCEDSKMNISTKGSPVDCMIGTLQQLQKDRNSKVLPAKATKQTRTNKRKAKPGENHKPRPRDRQLIQDRIKELRELIPSGSKCSIDGLLDRTIKHMQFLRRVTDQADKIKQHDLREVSDQQGLKPHAIKSSNVNGTSWALELGCEQQTCPIVVKDLECQGHMLIEMLCNDHGRFLEIADVIYGLELTILKGVMEKGSDNSTWAHFIVEASGSFHRLDIFWPLMQLLQQNRAQISSKI